MPRARLQDIVTNIDRVRAHLTGMKPDPELDDKTRDAVERCLERISEAAKKLGATNTMWWMMRRSRGSSSRNLAKSLCPLQLPDNSSCLSASGAGGPGWSCGRYANRSRSVFASSNPALITGNRPTSLILRIRSC